MRNVMTTLISVQETSGGYPIAAAAFALGFAAVHLAVGRWEFARAERRRQFLSAGGGASVAYVFVLILPEVSEAATVVGEIRGDVLLAEQLVFLVALVGFVVFYGIEVLVTQRRDEDVEESKFVYRAHLLSFAIYSGLIGYLLFHQEVAGLSNLFFYAVAMALHFAVTDYGLHRHYGASFDTGGRWVLASGTVFGAAVGFLTGIDVYALALLFAFVSGGIVFNVIKEELPALTESRFVSFVVGAVVFAALVLLT
ncbi:MAG: hypothetical protein ABEJ28_11860 [Salinigranum sp.]